MRFLRILIASAKAGRWFSADWAMALWLLLIFLFVAGYRYGWDDQHLEIPLLKSLIDSALYPNDYYVQSLKNHFPGYFYSLLARFITLEQIPAAYLFLYLASRYFLLFWMYKFWHLVSKDKIAAFMCVFVMFGLARVPEFFYQTFSHQEFTLALVFWGLYLFYTDRFIMASAILGIAANFHAVYSVLPMSYLIVYLVLKKNLIFFRKAFLATLTFLFFASPIIVLIIQKRIVAGTAPEAGITGINWLELYRIYCLQNFPFSGVSLSYLFKSPLNWLIGAQKEILLLSLFLLNFFFNPQFRKDAKARSIVTGALLLLSVSYYFTYLQPSRFVIDLNFIRSIQFLSFLLSGYTVLLALELLHCNNFFLTLLSSTAVSFLILEPILDTTVVILLFLTLCRSSIGQIGEKRQTWLASAAVLFSFISLSFLIYRVIHLPAIGKTFIATLLTLIVFISLWSCKKHPPSQIFPHWLLLVPLTGVFLFLVHNHWRIYTLETKAASGFWKLQRDWVQLQKYVQANTPQEAVFLTPHDTEMGGFRIFSERTTVFCDRDYGLIGFDYAAAIEGLKRQHDVEPIKVRVSEPLTKETVIRPVLKYHVDYVAFMRYYAPQDNLGGVYEKVYENATFSLHKIHHELLNKLLWIIRLKGQNRDL